MQKHYIKGDVIKNRVQELGLTMKKIEELSRVSKRTFYKQINGISQMKMDIIEIIADKLEVYPSTLLN